MKKHSNEPIPQIVDLGDNRYEFCFNHETKEDEERISYLCDIVVCPGTPEREAIRKQLIKEGYSPDIADGF
jgi:hypothetical protein